MKRRIFMTTDTVGGVWHYVLELARGLVEYDVEVTLAALGPGMSADQEAAAEAVPGLTVAYRVCRLEWMRDPWDDLARAGDWLLELVARTRPDVVHLNHYCHGALPWPAPVLVVAHSCVYSWFEAVHGTEPGMVWRRYRQAVARGLAAADLIAAPSAAMLRAAERIYGPLPATAVIANGRRAADYRPEIKMPRILAVGRLWDQGKNLTALARVAPNLIWPVRLVGETRGPDGQTFEQANVEPGGVMNQAELKREYAEAAIYAAPARYEPFGLGILEAALAGAALVLGDIPSLREVWGAAARYVSPDDDAALVEVLNEMADKPAVRRQWAARARARALKYSAKRMTTAYMAAYERLAHR
jgi:glycosyltransferase involved in cell wall biosynthesis